MKPGSQTPSANPALTERAINTIRFLAVDAVNQAKSGHPGMPMGMAAPAYVLWTRFLRHNPKNPAWPNRDRFILSAGHGSMLLYALLHLTGYDLSLEQIKNFRQWKSGTPGHPEHGSPPGVETTTGPLGQGFATAVGMAIAQRYLNRLFPGSQGPLMNHRIYGICSDGDLMEGLSSEAASLAGHLQLGNIVFLWDDNRISIDGPTDLAFSEDVGRRFEGFGWHVERVADANDLDAVERAITKGRDETNRPSLILVRSIIGFGSPNRAGTGEAHGAPLGEDETRQAKAHLGWPLTPPFVVPDDVLAHMGAAIESGANHEAEWDRSFQAWAATHPKEKALWDRLTAGRLPEGWEKAVPNFASDAKMATREASGKVINALAPLLPELIGGSADLTPSNNTAIKGDDPFSAKVPGRNLHFGVREHAMAAALNGMALSEMLIPYGGTFLIFSDYMKGALRISALTRKRVVYIFTHDSIGLGEDGPTHQPIEQLAHLRATPNVIVFRPADAHETAAAWRFAIGHTTGPVALALTRQPVPVLSPTMYPALGSVEKGAYVLSEAKGGKPDAVIIATGSEVHLALQAQDLLQKDNVAVRVVSMPSMELFERQPAAYQDAVLPPDITHRLAVEALSTFGWHRWVGPKGEVLGMTSFGASAPSAVAMTQFGFTVENIVTRLKAIRSA